MKVNFGLKALLVLNVVALAGFGQAQPTVKKVAPKPTVSVVGKDLFRQYCAVCHGTDGKGAGPAAVAMKNAPTDLTQISRKNGGSFPEERMMRMLRGEEAVASHGSQDMPVWGNVFNNMSSNLEQAQARVHALLQYVEDMQAK
jgi:mono/diheme cytochrome c family protein